MPIFERARQLMPSLRTNERLRREFEREGLRRVTLDGLRLVDAGLGHVEYQPLYGLEHDSRAPEWGRSRNTDERWLMIEPHLPKSGSALDIGSQHGWFTFKLAEHGLFALGVERAARSAKIAQLLALEQGKGRAAFVRTKLTPETAAQLPTADVVLCMSVFHHFVRKDGRKQAESTMRELASRCRKYMFFETGQADDAKHGWAKQLAFMGDSPKQWMIDFLLSIGFADVTHIGDTLGYQNESPRHLMMASKSTGVGTS